jgi:DNA-binding response OmpR family regulator
VDHRCDRILLVDNDHDIVDALADALRSDGATVEAALGVNAALRIIANGFAS